MRRACLAAALVSVTSLAAAQDPSVTRRALIQRAAVARDRGDHTLALALAVEAARLAMTPSLRAFISHEHAALGQHADALAQAEACVREAESSPPRPERDTLLTECRTLASSQRPLVGRAPPPTAPPASAAPAPGPALSRGVNPGPWVVGGIGVASLSLTLVFVGLRADALSSRDSRCQGRAPCTLTTDAEVTSARDAQERAADFSTAVNVTLAAGGAALVAAGVWFALDRLRAEPRVAPSLTIDGRGAALVHLSGSF